MENAALVPCLDNSKGVNRHTVHGFRFDDAVRCATEMVMLMDLDRKATRMGVAEM